jgi:hypothetical protein
MVRIMSGHALITGASAGLGRELARLFAADGHGVILVARRLDRLEELADELRGRHGVEAVPLAADLTDPDAPAHIVDHVRARGLTVDYLVNNAGFGAVGAFAAQPTAGPLAMIQVNVAALTHLTSLMLPDMVERRFGRILNLGSTAGFVPGPFMATYYATKAFVNSFTEALAYELDGTGVTATVSCPGATATEFGGVAGNERSLLFQLGAAESTTVAREAYQAMHRGQRMVVHGWQNKLSAQSVRVSPRAMTLAVAARLNRTH